MKYKAILLDWDGCLAKTLDVWLNAYRNVLLEKNIKLNDQNIVENFFGTNNEFSAEYGFDVQYFTDRVLSLVKENIVFVELSPGVLEMFDLLNANNIKTAIVTSNYKDIINKSLEYNNLKNILVISHEDVTKHKPDPEPLNMAMSLLGVNPNETIMMGDSDKDSIASRLAGVTSVIYYPLHNRKFYSEKFINELNADFLIEDISELKNILL